MGGGVENRQVALVTRCLWEFQEMTPEIDGLLLVGTDGCVLASTLSQSEATSRVAAIASTLVSLAKQAADEWERGSFHEVRVRFKDQQGRQRDAQLIAVSESIVLVIVLERATTLSLSGMTLMQNTRQALQYVARVLLGENPPPALWRTED